MEKKEKKQKESGDERSKKISKMGGGLKNKGKNPNGEEGRKIKSGVFTKWQLNSLTPIKFV
jgi:hypothetical protein